MTREERYIEYDERIDRYLRNLMDDSERAAFEQDVDNDQELRERLVATSMFVKGVARTGMQREGQTQLDAIRQLDRDQFIRAMQGAKAKRPHWRTLSIWASGIAALAIVAFGLYTFSPKARMQMPSTAKVEETVLAKPTVPTKPAKPTLAALADEYNQPFDNEPDEFLTIRQQIEAGHTEDMMAVVDDIDKVAWPTAQHGPKGADDDDAIKYTTANFNDCTHWYKALAYLKAGDKASAVEELDQLVENGKNEDLVGRAASLLKQLEQ